MSLPFAFLRNKKPKSDLTISPNSNTMKPPTTLLLFVGALIFFAAGNVRSDASDHRYKEGDSVPLYVSQSKGITISTPLPSL